MDGNQPISRNRKTLLKSYILSVFEFVTYKKTRKLMQSTLYWETKGHCKKVYNECFIVQKNHKAKNAKSHVYGEVS